MNLWRKLFPAKKPESQWNDLERALLDDLRNNPQDWEISATEGRCYRVFNRRKQQSTALDVTPALAGWLPTLHFISWAELGDAVGDEFRYAFGKEAFQLRCNRTNAVEKKKKAETADRLRQAYGLK